MFSKSSECNFAYDYCCTETCCDTQGYGTSPFCATQGYGTSPFCDTQGYGTSPFCATMAQPLIYYCQTPQPNLRQRSENVRKDNRNCFTKAFQWYTQEHVPHRDEAKKSGDVKGFANWLDSKYDQYLQDQCDTCGYKVKHTSITEAYRPCETRRKKFRVKSPWSKKRYHKETGDVTSKCSIHYILKPKDISRPASETNEMSKSMMMSSEVILSHYSHSCTSLRLIREPSVAVEKKNQEVTQSSIFMRSNKNATKSLSKMDPVKPKDVKCMCAKVSKRNASSQSDPLPKSPSKSVPKVETHSQTLPKTETPVQLAEKAAPCSTLPKAETPVQLAQKAAPCSCRASKITKISHPTKIEIEFDAKPSLSHMESITCECTKELIPKADAQCQIETDVMTCSCGSDRSITQETIQVTPKKVRLHPCNCETKDFERCPLETPLTISSQNQPNHCHHCIPCKRTTTVTDEGQNSNRSNKTTPNIIGLLSVPSNKKTTGCDGIPAANPTTSDGVQTSNQTKIANGGVQTSNHSIRIFVERKYLD